MKKTEKIISVFLCAVLCVSCLVFPGAAKTAYPQSAHPYANDADETWEYSVNGAKGLYITFSDKCSFEESALLFYGKNGELLDLTLEEALEMPENELVKLVYDIGIKDGDIFAVSDGEEYIGVYTGDELAGKTVYVPGEKAEFELITDESVTDYGFAIDRIATTAPTGVYTVTYDLDGRNDVKNCYSKGETAEILSGSGIMYGDKVCKAWSLKKGGNAEYDGGEELVITSNVVLYPVYTPILFTSDEAFSFDNDYEPFAVNEFDISDEDSEPVYVTNYYMSDSDYAAMINNAWQTGALGALSGLISYPYTQWGGSCYGMSVTAALQHYGLLDLLRYQDGAECVRELEPSPELISCINYYQGQEYPASMVQNSADFPGTYNYSYQLGKMYNEVKNGKIVIFGFYENHSFDSMGHAVLLTGAYDDLDGNHVLVAYDCNYGSWYTDGIATLYVISPDFSRMASEMYGEIIGFDWLSDLSCFESFDINGGGDATGWYMSIINHIRDFFEMILSFFRSLFML